MTDTLHLQFGANQYLIPAVRAAWGARLIVRQDGDVDFVPDRQSTAGDDALVDATLAWLNENGVLYTLRATVRDLLRDGQMQTRTRAGHWLYEDRRGLVLGNTNASAGYLYVVGWLFEALEPGHPTKGADLLVQELAQVVDKLRP